MHSSSRPASGASAGTWGGPHSIPIEEAVTLAARDGYPLHGTVYVNPCAAVERVAIFNPGGGLAVRRYARFLRYLASCDITVISYDYRGVGASSPQNRSRFEAGIEDWAELDQSAVIDFVRERYPSASISSVSHSIGCMVAAGAPNAHLVDQMVLVAPHTGYWADYRADLRVPLALMWHVLMPVLARVLGYFPGHFLRLGDDFPARVALQWGGRLEPHYRFGIYGGDARREYLLTSRMAELATTALVLSASDDCFATDVAIRRFLMGMPSVRLVRRELDRKDVERGIGHWGFFSRHHSAHWHLVSRFLKNDVALRINPEWSRDFDD